MNRILAALVFGALLVGLLVVGGSTAQAEPVGNATCDGGVGTLSADIYTAWTSDPDAGFSGPPLSTKQQKTICSQVWAFVQNAPGYADGGIPSGVVNPIADGGTNTASLPYTAGAALASDGGVVYPATIPALFAQKQWEMCRISQSDLGSSSGFTCAGSSNNWGLLGTIGSSGNNETFSVYVNTMFVQSGSSAGQYTGIAPQNRDNTSFSFDPRYTQYAGLGNGTTAFTRMWVAIGATTGSACTFLNATPGVTTSTSSACKFAGISYDSAVSANYQCCAGNGTNYNCVNTGVAADTNYHTFSVYIPAGHASPSISCSIDGTQYAGPSTVPPSNVWLAAFPFTTITPLSNTSVYLNYGWNTLETY